MVYGIYILAFGVMAWLDCFKASAAGLMHR